MNLLEKTAEILRENGKSLNVIRLFGANLRAEPINAGFLEANQLSQISKKSCELYHSMTWHQVKKENVEIFKVDILRLGWSI